MRLKRRLEYMKKIFAILMALVLAIGCTAALAEEDSVPPSTPEMKAYESYWVGEDGNTLAWIGRQDDGFQIQAVQKTGEDTFTSWEYVAGFDAETKSIRNADGTKCDCKVTNAQEEVIDGTNVDGIKASFTIGEDGILVWKDEQAGREMKLQKIGNFIGIYIGEGTVIYFVWNVHENHYNVLPSVNQSENETWEYQLNGTYDPATETVQFKGLKQLLTYKEDGEIDTAAEVKEGELEGTFSFNENGGLVWQSSDKSGDGITFEKMDIPLWANGLEI